jgi:DNA-binding transcriptional ArsR family regulator
MRPPARPNRNFYHPLDAILGTPAAVRILRMLSLQGESVSPLYLALHCCLGRAGTWQALRRLQAAEIIEQCDGRPRFPRYRLAAAHPLTPIVRELFERERAAAQSYGLRGSAVSSAIRSLASFTLGWNSGSASRHSSVKRP